MIGQPGGLGDQPSLCICLMPEKSKVTRKTKELDHEKLVTVFLGPLSDRHIFISDGKHVFDCSVEQTDHSVEQRLSLAYRGDLS
jgi:hypothetical protein